MAEPNQNNNIDDLLIDVKSLLQDEEEPVRQRDRTLRQKLETDREATQIFDERYTSIIRGASESADRAVRDYAQQPQEQPPEDGDEAPAQPSFVAYNSDFADNRFRENFAPRQPAQPRRKQTQADRAQTAKRPPAQGQSAPSDDDYEDDEPPRGGKKRRGCGGCLIWLLVVLALIGGLCYGALRLLGSLAKKDDTRRPGVSTVLIAGTDDSGLRTDTLMLVTVDEKEKTYNVLSIPRDTLTYAPYSVPKINGAYGYYGCGEAGMEALLDLVQDCVGFRPDGYVLIDWNGFRELVDVMGGIDFEVPMDMELDGITLTAGMQHLDGAGALTVARFRAGYSLADLQRVQVQRQLINAALNQWLNLRSILKIPDAIACVKANTVTDLDLLNILWLARDLKVCDAGVNETLPGSAQMIGDGSYYVLDPAAVAQLVSEYFNPYVRDITTDDLYIKVG